MSDSIFDLAENDLQSAQAKITFLGTQTKPVGTVTFASTEHPLSMERFVEFQPGNRPYSNDGRPYTQHFSVSPAEFHRMLAALKPILSQPSPARGVVLSFVFVADAAGQEFRMNPDAGQRFYPALIDSLAPDNEPGRSILSKQFEAALPGAD